MATGDALVVNGAVTSCQICSGTIGLEEIAWNPGVYTAKREANGTVSALPRGEKLSTHRYLHPLFLNIVKGEGDISRRERGTI